MLPTNRPPTHPGEMLLKSFHGLSLGESVQTRPAVAATAANSI